MTTLDDFYGDGSASNTPECSFCGSQDGKLIVAIRDHYGPTHWHHVACKAKDDANKGTPITPTWDEAMDATFNDPLIDGHEMQADFNAEIQAEAASGLPQLCQCGELAQDDARKGTPIMPTWARRWGAMGGFICYTCRAEIVDSVIEADVSPVEVRFYCEGCFTQAQSAKLSPEDVDYTASQYQTIY